MLSTYCTSETSVPPLPESPHPGTSLWKCRPFLSLKTEWYLGRVYMRCEEFGVNSGPGAACPPFLPRPLSSTTLQGSQLTVKSPREHEAFQPEA